MGKLQRSIYIILVGIFCAVQCVWAVRYQFFFGLGQSIGDAKLHTNATNQMTKNTSSVNEKGGYYYSQTQLGNYDGKVKDITSAYVGSEITFDKMGIFTLRGYISASYSNKVDFGNLNNLRDGNLRQCNQDEMPSLDNICFRDGFYISAPNNGKFEEVKFNANPGFANTISNNAFMMSYGIGFDIGINIPIHILVTTFSNYKKMIPLRIGGYGGIGYDFTTYSLGHYDNRTYNNTTSGGETRDPSTGQTTQATGVALHTNDILYLSGAGAFARFGASLYVYDNIRIDFGVKMPIQIAGDPSTKSQRWYQLDSVNTPQGIDKVFTQQLLKQEYNAIMKSYYQFAINVLF